MDAKLVSSVIGPHSLALALRFGLTSGLGVGTSIGEREYEQPYWYSSEARLCSNDARVSLYRALQF